MGTKKLVLSQLPLIFLCQKCHFWHFRHVVVSLLTFSILPSCLGLFLDGFNAFFRKRWCLDELLSRRRCPLCGAQASSSKLGFSVLIPTLNKTHHYIVVTWAAIAWSIQMFQWFAQVLRWYRLHCSLRLPFPAGNQSHERIAFLNRGNRGHNFIGRTFSN